MRCRVELSTKVRVSLLTLVVGIGARTAIAKTIQATPGVPVIAETTWYYINCTTSAGLGSYSINIAPMHGTVTFADVSGPLPGCPAGSPSLPAVQAYYTWTDTSTSATTDFFELYYNLNGQVAAVLDVDVTLGCPTSGGATRAKVLDFKNRRNGALIVTRSGPSLRVASDVSSAGNSCTSSPVVITTTTLPDAVSGDAYSVQLMASGGVGPISWSIDPATLPAGFALTSDGMLTSSGTPAATPGQVDLTFTATDGVTTATATLTLAIAPADCSKLFTVTPQNLGAGAVGRITVTADPKAKPTDPTILRFQTNIVNTWFGWSLGQDGMLINIGSALTRNSAVPLPVGQVYLGWVQNLTAWPSFGHATYGVDQEERFAAFADDASPPLLDVFNASVLPFYDTPQPITMTPPILEDSPNIIAPLVDNDNRPLTSVNYVKTFTTYLGCYNEYDRSFYPGTNPFSVFHILAAVDWHANYSGTIVSSRNRAGRYVFENFVPNDPGNDGTQVDRKYVPATLPMTTLPLANGSTTYR